MQTAPIETVSAAPQLIGSPNRTMVALGDAEAVRAAVGPATAQAVAAMSARRPATAGSS